MPQPFFSIIIVTWNGLALLKKYLPSVVKTTYSNYEIIIADNHSTDGTSDWVSSMYPDKVKIAELDENYGYCGGNNRAAECAKGDILLFLNNDVRVEADWLDCLALSFQNQNIAVVQPKLLSDRDPFYFEYAGAAGGFIDSYGFPFCRGRLFDSIEKDLGQYDVGTDIFWASGAALAVRTDIFKILGGFDESFEFHMEEIDLCWRIHLLGKEIKYIPNSVVYHFGGGSLPMGSPRKLFYNYRNSLYMLFKNVDEKSQNRILFKRFLFDLTALIQQLILLRFKNVAAIIKAYIQAYSKKEYYLNKQIKTATKSTIPTQYSSSVVLDYFIRRKKKFSDLNFSVK